MYASVMSEADNYNYNYFSAFSNFEGLLNCSKLLIKPLADKLTHSLMKILNEWFSLKFASAQDDFLYPKI